MFVMPEVSPTGQYDRFVTLPVVCGQAPEHAEKPVGGWAMREALSAAAVPGTVHHRATCTKNGPGKSGIPSPVNAGDRERFSFAAPTGSETSLANVVARFVAAAFELANDKNPDTTLAATVVVPAEADAKGGADVAVAARSVALLVTEGLSALLAAVPQLLVPNARTTAKAAAALVPMRIRRTAVTPGSLVSHTGRAAAATTPSQQPNLDRHNGARPRLLPGRLYLKAGLNLALLELHVARGRAVAHHQQFG